MNGSKLPALMDALRGWKRPPRREVLWSDMDHCYNNGAPDEQSAGDWAEFLVEWASASEARLALVYGLARGWSIPAIAVEADLPHQRLYELRAELGEAVKEVL